MGTDASELRKGDEIVSDFSGRAGHITAVYARDVEVLFEGYRESIRIGFDAAVAYRRSAVGNRD